MLPDINLLPKYEKERSLLYILFLAGFILAFVFTAFLAYQYMTVHDGLKAANAKNKELTERKEVLQHKVAKQGPKENESIKEAVVYAEKYAIPTSILMDQLMTFLPATGYLSEYTYKDGEVTINSHFETMTDASSYIAKLNSSNFITQPLINRVETYDLEQPETNSAPENEPNNQAELSPFELLPRYQVTYSFKINSAQLKKETEEK